MPTEPFVLTDSMASGIAGAVVEHFLQRYPPVSVVQTCRELEAADLNAAQSHNRLDLAGDAEHQADIALRKLTLDRLQRRLRLNLRFVLREMVTGKLQPGAPEDLVFAIAGYVLETEQSMLALVNGPSGGPFLDLVCSPGSTGAMLKSIEELKLRLATMLAFYPAEAVSTEGS
jgi:hypothetical protein